MFESESTWREDIQLYLRGKQVTSQTRWQSHSGQCSPRKDVCTQSATNDVALAWSQFNVGGKLSRGKREGGGGRKERGIGLRVEGGKSLLAAGRLVEDEPAERDGVAEHLEGRDGGAPDEDGAGDEEDVLEHAREREHEPAARADEEHRRDIQQERHRRVTQQDPRPATHAVSCQSQGGWGRGETHPTRATS